MDRPYKVKNYKLVGALAVIMSGFMVVMYILPGSAAALTMQEWIIAGGWCILGVVFCALCKAKYKEEFGILVEIVSEEDAAALQSTDEEISAALDAAIDAAINKILAQRAISF